MLMMMMEGRGLLVHLTLSEIYEAEAALFICHRATAAVSSQARLQSCYITHRALLKCPSTNFLLFPGPDGGGVVVVPAKLVDRVCV